MPNPKQQNLGGEERKNGSGKKDDVRINEIEISHIPVPAVPTSGFEIGDDPVDDLRMRLSKWDPNQMDKRESKHMDSISYDEEEIKERLTPAEDSPYAEVRVAVRNWDEEYDGLTIFCYHTTNTD